MANNIIFIHVPKTGGTTINTAMQNSFWQSKPDFYYRHIVSDTKKSNAGEIFKEENKKKFSHFDIIMMLRHPVDRAISEYYFMKERREFFELLHPKPKSFSEFVNNPQTHNYVLSFLLGERIYATNRPAHNDLEKVISAIETLPIHVGIFEDFGASLDMFSNETGIKWKKNIDVKRMTFKRPSIEEIPEELKAKILSLNALDFELYNFCLETFNRKKIHLSSTRFKFNADKYNHVLPYMANFPFFEFCMESKLYVNANNTFFKELTHYLINILKINDGYKLTKAWNKTFLNSVNEYYPNSTFFATIQQAYSINNEPIEQTIAIARAVDSFIDKNPQVSAKYLKPMLFNELLVEIPKTEIKELFKQLFYRKSY
jgi:hypothetical protein